MSEKLSLKKAMVIYGIAALSVSLLCMLLRFLSTVFFFDRDIGYYESGALLPMLACALPAIAVIAAFLIYAVPSLRLSEKHAEDKRAVRISAAVVSLAFLLFSAVYIISTANYVKLFSELPASYIVGAVASLGACAFFALKALGLFRTLPYALCGILSVLWFVLALVESYFDTFVPMNAPTKLVFQFACLSAMLLIVSEIRMGFDRARSRMHLFCATAAAVLLPMSSVVSVVCSYLDKMPKAYTLFYYDAVCIALSAFATVRLIELCFFKTEEKAVAADGTEESPEDLTDNFTEISDNTENTENTENAEVEE